MTRATLLHLLAHPTALTGADVRALEALAAAFPYCQTAHLLLAKAAHDQDSMLAGQRLRRAATYAADRTLLRQLIEQPLLLAEAEATPVSVPVAAWQSGTTALPASSLATPPTLAVAEPPASAPATPALPSLADYPSPELLAVSVPATPAVATEAAPEASELAAAEVVPTFGSSDSSATSVANDAVSTEAAPELSGSAAATVAERASAQPVEAAAPETEEISAPLVSPVPAAASSPASTTAEEAALAPTTADRAAAASTSATPEPSAAADAPEPLAVADISGEFDAIEIASDEPVDSAKPEAAPELLPDAELPPLAPPVRPPEQAEAARHEFGLAPPEAAELAPYQLPELELAVTVPLPPGPATPRLPAFSGVPDVAYAPGEGSRLGFCLVPAAEATEAASDQVPPTRLPPAGEFFAPDALLTEYVATPPNPAANPLDLIDSFLQRGAVGPRRRPQAPAAGQQTDLSARSTRAVPELASESLALILVRQGKIEQAIVIYERLMVKNPEKMAYFAAQIDQLRPAT